MPKYKCISNRQDCANCKRAILKHVSIFKPDDLSLKDTDAILTYKNIWQYRNTKFKFREIRDIFEVSVTTIRNRKKKGAYLIGKIYVDLMIRDNEYSMESIEFAFAEILGTSILTARAFIKDFPVNYCADTGSDVSLSSLINAKRALKHLEVND